MVKFLFRRNRVSVYYHLDNGTYSMKDGAYAVPDKVRVPLAALPYELQADAQEVAAQFVKQKAMYLLG